MEALHKNLVEHYQEVFINNPEILAVLFYGGVSLQGPNQPDTGFLVLSDSLEPGAYTEDYQGTGVFFQIMSPTAWMDRMENRASDEDMAMVFSAQLLFDRAGQMDRILKKIQAQRQDLMKNFMFREYSNILDCFAHCSEYYRQGSNLDAYKYLMDSMVHWARLILYQNGQLPGRELWSQVKKYNIGVYKLYEELITGCEPVEKKIELMQLVYANMILARSHIYTGPLLDYLSRAKEPKSYQEIVREGNFKGMDIQLNLVLEKLVEMKILKRMMPGCEESSKVIGASRDMRYMISA